jgi:hypothetical protein
MAEIYKKVVGYFVCVSSCRRYKLCFRNPRRRTPKCPSILNPFLTGLFLASFSSELALSSSSSVLRWDRLLLLPGMFSTPMSFFVPSNTPLKNCCRPTRNGIRIQDDKLREWLRRRGLHLACFCPLVSEIPGQSASCQIVHCRGGSVKAFCTEFPPKCGFYGEF